MQPAAGRMTAPSGVDDFSHLDLDELWQSYIDLETSMEGQNWHDLVSEVENLPQDSESFSMHVGGF
jgi:hypothetical protein